MQLFEQLATAGYVSWSLRGSLTLKQQLLKQVAQNVIYLLGMALPISSQFRQSSDHGKHHVTVMVLRIVAH